MSIQGEGVRTLVLGLGNPILCDDRVGLEVVREVCRRLGNDSGVEFVEACVAGLDLLDVLSGYSHAIVVDALSTPDGEPGSVIRMVSGDLHGSARLAAIHEVNVGTALTLGRLLGIALPDEITIYGVEVQDAQTFGERMSPAVSRAVARAAAQIIAELERQRDLPAGGGYGREDQAPGC